MYRPDQSFERIEICGPAFALATSHYRFQRNLDGLTTELALTSKTGDAATIANQASRVGNDRLRHR